MKHPERIPLFPLKLVLFPGMSLPLHIFEPHYKRMTQRCLAEQMPFGTILASEKGMATVGTTAEIVQKVKEYPDGRMDILTVGQAIFSVNELFSDEEYLEALIEYQADPPQPPDPLQQAELVGQFNRCHTLLYGHPWSSSGEDEPFPLSFSLAALLPLDLVEKQRLLEMPGENTRRAYLLDRIVQLIPQILERQRIRRSAGGNGRPIN